MDNQLYVRIRGKVTGPYDQEKLRWLARRGQLSRAHELSQDTTHWVRASTYPELFSLDDYQGTAGLATTEARHGPTQSRTPERALPLPEAPMRAIGPGGRRSRSSQGRWYLRPVTIVGAVCVAFSFVVLVAFLVGKWARQSHQADEAAVTIAKHEVSPPASEHTETRQTPAPSEIAVAQTPSQKPEAASSQHRPKKANTPTAPTKETTPEPKILDKPDERRLTAAAEGENTPPNALGSPTLSSIKEHKAIADAIGKVIVGGEVTNYQGKTFQLPKSSGSAFAINHNGAMLTNKHVVEGYVELSHANQLKADLSREYRLGLHEMLWVFVAGEEYAARLVYVSPKHDYAILQVERHFARPFALKLSSDDLLDAEVRAVGFPGVASIGFSDKEISQDVAKSELRHADVAEFFNARELQYLLTSGRVSQVTSDAAMRVTWLQHTASIAPGNSGGPLVLPDATVVGINTMIVGDAKELGAQFFRALCLGQFRDEIDRRVSGVTWIP
jgi:S1-C subfamily serine protease